MPFSVIFYQTTAAPTTTSAHIQLAKARILHEFADELQATTTTDDIGNNGEDDDADDGAAFTPPSPSASDALPSASALTRHIVFDHSDERTIAEVRRDVSRHRPGPPSHGRRPSRSGSSARLRQQQQHRLKQRRRHVGAVFSPWSPWSKCDHKCVQGRERHCYNRKKCGTSRHIEERHCPSHR